MPNEPRRVEKNCPFFTFPSIKDNESGQKPRGFTTVAVSAVSDTAVSSDEEELPPHETSMDEDSDMKMPKAMK